MTDIQSQAAVSLAAAWKDRARAALNDLRAAETAPAFFKPQWVERATEEYVTATRQHAFWSAQIEATR